MSASRRAGSHASSRRRCGSGHIVGAWGGSDDEVVHWGLAHFRGGDGVDMLLGREGLFGDGVAGGFTS